MYSYVRASRVKRFFITFRKVMKTNARNKQSVGILALLSQTPNKNGRGVMADKLYHLEQFRSSTETQKRASVLTL